MLEETLDEGFLVLLIVSGWGDWLPSSGDGFPKALAKEGRALGAFVDTPLLSLKAPDLTGRVSARLEGMAAIIDCRFRAPRLCLPPEFVDFVRVSVVWEATLSDTELRFDESEAIETRDGVRLTVEGGMTPSSTPFWEWDDLDGDRE